MKVGHDPAVNALLSVSVRGLLTLISDPWGTISETEAGIVTLLPLRTHVSPRWKRHCCISKGARRRKCRIIRRRSVAGCAEIR